jgi:hypothetical protein
MPIDVTTVLTSTASAFGISLAGAWWLSRTLIEQKLGEQRIRFEGEIRRQVESELAKKAADIQYELEARKRLYIAIGPLRFQLILACSEVSSRIQNYGFGKRYKLGNSGYYGHTTLYRLARPLAVMELIEQQMSFADFSVDRDAVTILKFKRAVAQALSDGDPILNREDANWNGQVEHLFYHSIGSIGHALIQCTDGNCRVLTFDEFAERLENNPGFNDGFAPLSRILDRFSIETHAIFWVRLVCLGYLCSQLVARLGGALGLERIDYDVEALLKKSSDEHIQQHLPEYRAAFARLF